MSLSVLDLDLDLYLYLPKEQRNQDKENQGQSKVNIQNIFYYVLFIKIFSGAAVCSARFQPPQRSNKRPSMIYQSKCLSTY